MLLSLFLLSLTGIPGTAGFIGKFYVFGGVVWAGLWWLAVIGVLMSAVSAYYYLRVIVYMFFKEPEEALGGQGALHGRHGRGALPERARDPGHRARAFVAVGRGGGRVRHYPAVAHASHRRLGSPCQQSAHRGGRGAGRGRGDQRRWGPPRSCGPGIRVRRSASYRVARSCRVSSTPTPTSTTRPFAGFSGPPGLHAVDPPPDQGEPQVGRTEDLAASALWGAYECLRHGVTSIADTSYGGSTVARAARAAGLRARVYLEVFGLDDRVSTATMERLEAVLDEAAERKRLATSPSAAWGRRLRAGGVGHLAARALHGVQALYREVARFARALRPAHGDACGRVGDRGPAAGRAAPGLLALAYRRWACWSGQPLEAPGRAPGPVRGRGWGSGPGHAGGARRAAGRRRHRDAGRERGGGGSLPALEPAACRAGWRRWRR